MKHLSLCLFVTLAVGCDSAMVAELKAKAEAAEQNAAAAEVEAEVNGAVAEAPPTKNAALTVEVKAELQGKVKPEELDLEGITYLVKKGKVKNAAELEKKINNPKEKLNDIDIDGDGKIDKIQVVEVQKPNDVKVFELHIIPSKTKSKSDEVIVAYIGFEPDTTTNVLMVEAVFTPVVVGYDTIVYDYSTPIVVKSGKIVVVESNPFYGWVYTVNRPAFVGVYVYSAPPPPVFVIHHGGPHYYHHKHKGKWKGKGKHWGGWH